MKKFDIHEWQAKYLFEQSTNLYGPDRNLYHKRDKLKREIEVTGMEPDSSNMESEYKIIGPENKNEPLDNVSIEYKGEVFV